MAHHNSQVNFHNVSVCCITLNSTDCIRLVGLPSDLVEVIRAAIQSSWGQIQKEQDYFGSYQFKLKGNPWVGSMDESVRSRSLLVSILAAMARHGWNLIQAADTCKKLHDKDSLFFELGQPDPEVKLFGLSFNMGDRIRLIDAPTHLRAVLSEAVAARTTIRKSKEYYGSYELKLASEPWYYGGAEGVQTRLILCQIIANFRALGYKLYASVDINSGGEHGSDLESWVFRAISPPFWQ